jgi:hypothetical protein
MSEIKYEIVKKIGVLSKAGSGLGEAPFVPLCGTLTARAALVPQGRSPALDF